MCGAEQIGHAENNIELHPVLDIQFNGPEPPEFESNTTVTMGTALAETLISTYQYGIWLMWWVISLGMTVFYIVAIRETVVILRRSNDWSLAKALQEADGKPSSSRLIAFLGLLILIVLYMELGYVVIWRLLNNEPMPDVQSFLLTGLSLFAPYAFNQIKQVALGFGSGDGIGRFGERAASGTENSKRCAELYQHQHQHPDHRQWLWIRSESKCVGDYKWCSRANQRNGGQPNFYSIRGNDHWRSSAFLGNGSRLESRRQSSFGHVSGDLG